MLSSWSAYLCTKYVNHNFTMLFTSTFNCKICSMHLGAFSVSYSELPPINRLSFFLIINLINNYVDGLNTFKFISQCTFFSDNQKCWEKKNHRRIYLISNKCIIILEIVFVSISINCIFSMESILNRCFPFCRLYLIIINYSLNKYVHSL